MARAYCNPFTIQHRRNIVRVNAVERKAERAAALL
jgi:hypothetical protein